MDLFEVIDDGVVDVPDQAWLLGRPFVDVRDRDAVIGVVEGLAILPVRPEHFGEAAVASSLGALVVTSIAPVAGSQKVPVGGTVR